MTNFASIFEDSMSIEEMYSIFNHIPHSTHYSYDLVFEWDPEHRWVKIVMPSGYKGYIPGTLIDDKTKVVYIDDQGDIEVFASWILPYC